MTPMRTGRVELDGPTTLPVPIVSWRRGPKPFKIRLKNGGNYGFYVNATADAERGYFLASHSNTDTETVLEIEIPAALGGEPVEDETVYGYMPDAEQAVVLYLVQPSTGWTMPQPITE